MSNNLINMDLLNDKSGLKVGFWNFNGKWLHEEKPKEVFFLK